MGFGLFPGHAWRGHPEAPVLDNCVRERKKERDRERARERVRVRA